MINEDEARLSCNQQQQRERLLKNVCWNFVFLDAGEG